MVNSATLKNNQNQSVFKNIMSRLSKIGAALMFPIAVLPVAAILLRISDAIPGDTAFSNFVKQLFSISGGGVFDNLFILFGIGLAFGFTKERRGEAAFAGFIAVIIVSKLVPELTKTYYGKIDFGAGKVGFEGLFGGKFNAIFGGNILSAMLVGALVAYIYNRANGVDLPKVLGFFSGRRLIPALAIIAATLFGIVWAVIFPWIAFVLFKISEAMSNAVKSKDGEIGVSARFTRAAIMGVYGFVNRLFIPFGLHHIPNNIFWFQLGEFKDETGAIVNGDILIFLKGVAKDNPGGIFQSGFFPMMMFGLPALVGAFIWTAESKEQKLKVAALFGSAAVVSFLTGITEPIEFAFLYASPLLYFVHAILTGIFAFITGAFGIQIGFGFSAGLLDYILSIPKSLAIINESGFSGAAKVFANPGWIFPIGLLCGASYFFLGTLIIKKLNLSTPGRKDGIILSAEEKSSEVSEESQDGTFSTKAKKIVAAFGGYDNLVELNNCSTRLRYTVKDGSKVSEEELKKAGVFGLVKVSDTSFQAIVGVEAEGLNNQITSNKK